MDVSDSLESESERVIAGLDVPLDRRIEILPAKLIQTFFGLSGGYMGLDLDKKRAIPSVPIVEDAGIVYDERKVVKRNENIELKGRIAGDILDDAGHFIIFACLAEDEGQHFTHGILFTEVSIRRGLGENNTMVVGE